MASAGPARPRVAAVVAAAVALERPSWPTGARPLEPPECLCHAAGVWHGSVLAGLPAQPQQQTWDPRLTRLQSMRSTRPCVPRASRRTSARQHACPPTQRGPCRGRHPLLSSAPFPCMLPLPQVCEALGRALGLERALVTRGLNGRVSADMVAGEQRQGPAAPCFLSQCMPACWTHALPDLHSPSAAHCLLR